MDLTSRFFRWEDVPALHALVSEKWRRDGPRVTLHVGDLYWQLRPRPGNEPTQDIRLWETTDGELAGFAWWDHVDSGNAIAHPDADPNINAIMLDWFEKDARRRGSNEFTTGCFVDDAARLSFLSGRGYERAEHGDPHLIISLETDAANPKPPVGYSVRSVEGLQEIEERAAVHRSAWSADRPSAVTTEVYLELIRLPGYRQDLDLVAVASNGEFVSCTNVWYDKELHVGEFEPVGCHPEHRRRGVTRALMLEGLRRLRNLGATQAIVYTSTDNPGAQMLYESCGFRVAGHNWNYTKKLE